MRISINVTQYSWPGRIDSALDNVARAADEAGLDTVWVADHLLQADPTADADAEMLEAYTTLGFVAARTERVRLGTMVTAVTYRPPALLVKAVTTLDVLSGGRAWLGLGSGYSTAEAGAMGLPLPPIAERVARLEETLELASRMWKGDDSLFDGAHHRFERPVGSPPPMSTPHPPVLVGGMGERTTLPLVARRADACNLFDIPDGGETVRRKLAVLAEHCEAHGRPFDDIEKTVSTRLEQSETAGAFADRCHRLGELGFDHVVVVRSGPFGTADVATLGEAVRMLGDG
ncbi:TIGR03560 family F420-dependent LLM class oxidoreductase [Saccharomonospora saliphila]|uniref:TIGR03560 family F420-dependent LLM class oxidoreductase n=1 Tax=Saccharomonospora saliphila TaxID=369829 RepID=UPI000382C345|nr:TIGR03560 family F420-dependent LLM class oxidoreductase [Saccharomonospora saliphila]